MRGMKRPSWRTKAGMIGIGADDAARIDGGRGRLGGRRQRNYQQKEKTLLHSMISR